MSPGPAEHQQMKVNEMLAEYDHPITVSMLPRCERRELSAEASGPFLANIGHWKTLRSAADSLRSTVEQ